MPKGTHFHQAHDAMSTDNKFRPEDEGVLTRDKQQFQASEIDKKPTPKSEEEFVEDQDNERTEQ
jgi:hypothetical protein